MSSKTEIDLFSLAISIVNSSFISYFPHRLTIDFRSRHTHAQSAHFHLSILLFYEIINA